MSSEAIEKAPGDSGNPPAEGTQKKSRSQKQSGAEQARIDQARDIEGAVGKMDQEKLAPGNRLAAFSPVVDAADASNKRVNDLELQLAHAREDKRLAFHDMDKKVKELRKGVYATFGGDSVEYESVGGTRISKRKRANRK